MSFICPEIRQYLGSTPSERHERVGSGPVRYRLAVVLPKDGLAAAGADPGAMLDYIEGALRWVASLRWSDRSVRSIDLELSCSPFPKRWNWTAQRVLGRCEVNSGETAFLSPTEREIRIWRREDWSKVVLHELLHAFMWDRLVQSSGSRSEGADGEALVEAVALLLHSLLLGGPSAPAVLDEERRWMLAQAKALTTRPWTAQQTQVRGYYLLKAALLAVPETYADFCRWICSPPPSTDTDLAARWPALAALARSRLDRLLSTYTDPLPVDDAQRRMSMSMVRNQLSLSPLRTGGRATPSHSAPQRLPCCRPGQRRSGRTRRTGGASRRSGRTRRTGGALRRSGRTDSG